MTTIVTRTGKGSALTWAEADANFTNLNSDKLDSGSIGTTIQAHSTQLDAVAALTPTDNGVVIGNGSSLVIESGATLKTSLGLTIGTDVQAYNANTVVVAPSTSGNVLTSNGASWTSAALPATTNTIIQVVEATPVTSVITCSTGIPFDDTIPQNTEGNEVITVTITPTSATNRLRIEFCADNICGTGSSGNITAALFQDATAGALAAAGSGYASTAPFRNIFFEHEMVAGTTSATTFKVRCGGAGITVYVNGDTSGTRIFGGISAARLRVMEIKV